MFGVFFPLLWGGGVYETKRYDAFRDGGDSDEILQVALVILHPKSAQGEFANKSLRCTLHLFELLLA